jgi:hypothetical protein
MKWFEIWRLDELKASAYYKTSDDNYSDRASINLGLLKRQLVIRLPRWLDFPKALKVPPQNGHRGFTYKRRREFGFIWNANHVIITFGQQADDSSIDRSWSFFMPWMEKRFSHRTFFTLDWKEHGCVQDIDLRKLDPVERQQLRSSMLAIEREVRRTTPKAVFQFADYDGEIIEATCFFESRSFVRGTGWFRWLAYIFPIENYISMDITFSKEVGKRKGSWKGGVIGHGIRVSHGETPEAAFRRYCAENSLTFITQLNAQRST